MDIISLEAFVLRRIRYGESSLIVSLFSDERGKLSVIAKGARSNKSKSGMASVLEPLNMIEAEVYIKPSREVQIIGKADIIADFSGIKSNLDRMETAAKILRTLDSLTHTDEPNYALWKAFENTLRQLDSSPSENLPSISLAFKARILSALGYEPILEICSRCDCEISGKAFFDAESGGIICEKCGPRGIMLTPADIETLRSLFYGDNTAVPHEISGKMEKIIDRHCEFHTDTKIVR
jgi:DNA repair protein RecO (recombination protein O)